VGRRGFWSRRVVPLPHREVRGRPLGEVREYRGEAAAELADLVFDPGRHFGMVRAQDETVTFELPEPLRQNLRGDGADPPLQFHETLTPSVVQRPQHRGGPAAEDEIHDGRSRAGLLRIVR
jgi:hypothetical protein